MRLRIVIRGVAYLILVVALLAAAIALNNRQYPPAGILRAEPSSAIDNLDAELARCKVLDIEAAKDAGCKAVWQASRARFLNAKEPYQDAPDSRPAATNADKAASGRASSTSDRAGQAR